MDELFGVLLVVMAVVAAVVFAAWIALVLVLKVAAYVLFAEIISFTLSIIAGVGWGLVLPWKALRGVTPKALLLTPELVVQGTAIPGTPKGESERYGWDSAWPTYFPYQARQDVRGVVAQARAVVERISRMVTEPMLWIFTVPVFVGVWIGIWLSTLVWVVVMSLVGAPIWALQRCALAAVRRFDTASRSRAKASLRCPHCYAVSTLPSYRCSGATCTVVHRTLLPGPLGLVSRQCSCGTRLPNTIRRAGARLRPVCPTCNEDLVAGSGVRQTVQVPVIGSVAAGKTRLLTAALVKLHDRLEKLGGSFSGLTESATEFLAVAQQVVNQHGATAKTDGGSPAGLPFGITPAKGKQVELQLLDAAGETFANWDTSGKLHYLDRSEAFIFVLDPLALPVVEPELRRAKLDRDVLVTDESQDATYGAAFDALRARGVDLKQRSLAVALTKGDILLKLPIARTLDDMSSSDIRAWLTEHGAEDLVNRFDTDFRKVQYFIFDSMSARAWRDPMSPWWILEWVLKEHRASLQLDANAPSKAPKIAQTTSLATGTKS